MALVIHLGLLCCTRGNCLW